MRKLFHILWKDHSKVHLFWAFMGTLAGMILLLSGMQFYKDLRIVLTENRDLLDPEYIIINKKVGFGQAFGISGSAFSPEEIEELREQPFTEKITPFISNNFPVGGYTQSERIPDFYSELFFEAIPDEYIDIKSEEWKWDPEEGTIPIIIPQDFLNLYNFGFAQSQGLPQVPKEVLSMVNFRIRLTNRFGQHTNYQGKIVGFSNRVHSILVPYDFLSWANDEFGYFEDEGPSRIIIVSKDPTDPEIIRFIDSHDYDTIREKLKGSRMNIILKFIISFLVLVAALIIGLAFLVFLLSLQLMISRSADKIKRLHKLGFHYREISRPYIVLLLILLTLVCGFSLLATEILTGQFASQAASWNLELSAHLHPIIYGTALGLMVVIAAANILSIITGTKKLCK